MTATLAIDGLVVERGGELVYCAGALADAYFSN